MRRIAIVLLLSAAARPAGQADKTIPTKSVGGGIGPGLQMLGTDFRANPKWTKNENVKTTPSCGLTLKNQKKGGSIVSPVFELNGVDQMGTTWRSDIPNDKVVIKLRTAKAKNDWGEWVTVNEQPKDNGKTIVGKNLEDIAGSKYIQYSIELNAATESSGCFKAIYLFGTSKSLIDALKKKGGQ